MSSPTKFSRSRSSGFLLFSLIFLVALAQILFLFPQDVCAVDVTLTWDANSETDLAGYRVFYREKGQTYNYSQPDWEGTNTSCTISNLNDNTTYCFVARAYDEAGNESGNSNEVYYQQNLAPTADDQSVMTDRDAPVNITLTATDGDEDSLTYTVVEEPSHGTLSGTAPNLTYSPDANYTGSDSFTFKANDGALDSNVATVTITVNLAGEINILEADFDTNEDGFSYVDDPFRGTNEPGFADGVWIASGGYTGGGLQVTLGGIDNAEILGISGGWHKYFTLSSSTQVGLSFQYNLTQTSNYENDELSQVLVSVDGVLYGEAPNDYVAQIVGNGNGGDPETTGWQLFQFNLGTLEAGNHSLVIGTYNNKKTYNDESTQVVIDDVLVVGVTDDGENLPPVADAGPDQTVDEEATVILNGSDSIDPDDGIAAYLWTQTGGTFVTLSDVNAVQPTFTAPNVGPGGASLIFRLTVTDNGGLQSTDTCIVNVTWQNEPPTADAGPDQTVNEGVTATLNGSNSSDPDGSIAAYLWTQTAGSSVTLSDVTSATPTFTAPDVGADGETLTFQLTVTDDSGLQAADSCIINVSWVDEPPTLSSISINGASSVNENATSNYTATATFSDGTTQTITESVNWTEDSSFATINSDGVLSVSEVMIDQAVTITASYTYDDVTETDQKVVTITDIPQSNLPPSRPVITSPYYGQVECELLLHITTEPFSDPDGDSHGQSRWQISKQEDFSYLILDVTSSEHLTELTAPRAVLEPNTTYYVRVQFYDVYLEPSEWSGTIEFTTTFDTNDLDADGIPDDQEVDDDIDLNGDGIADNYQPDVIKCVQSDIDDTTIGVSTASYSIAAIEAVGTIDPSTISDKTNKPEKFFSPVFFYRLSLHEPGATATIRIYFSKDISTADRFFKYDTIGGWQDYSQHTTFNNDDRSVTLEVKDGGYGDSDGVANGIIVDPSALVEATDVVDTSEGAGSYDDDGGGSSGDGCFIATAAFGSYAEPHVKLLRAFRDQCLLTNTPGRWFVRIYYRYSPFWADLINIHTWCKPIVRLALMPLVGISYVLIKAPVAMRILSGFLSLILVLGCFVRMLWRPAMGGLQP